MLVMNVTLPFKQQCIFVCVPGCFVLTEISLRVLVDGILKVIFDCVFSNGRKYVSGGDNRCTSNRKKS